MDSCSICKADIPESSLETWENDDGLAVHVGLTQYPSAIAETSIGEVEICEACYLLGLPKFFTSDDQAEIHFQFGVEYSHRENYDSSVRSLTEALSLSETADIYAHLGYSLGYLGDNEAAVAHYEKAPQIDPTHFMSTENLKNIQMKTRQ